MTTNDYLILAGAVIAVYFAFVLFGLYMRWALRISEQVKLLTEIKNSLDVQRVNADIPKAALKTLKDILWQLEYANSPKDIQISSDHERFVKEP